MTTLPPIVVPTLCSSSRAALTYEIEECPPATLRLILNTLCDQNVDVAQALHRALCIDKRPTPPTTSANTVIDLTESTESDKENALSISRKRKAPEDFLAVAKKIKSVGIIADASVSWRDRYVHCVQCYEMFDVMENEREKNDDLSHGAQSMHTSGLDVTDEEVSKDYQVDSASSSNSSDSTTHGNCIYHSGHLEADYESDFWADHDEDCHGTIDSMELRTAFPEGYTWDCCDKPGDTEGCERKWHQAGSVLEYYAKLRRSGGVD